MLITFKSEASGDVITMEESGRRILEILKKDMDAAQGIVTVAQLPDAISRLRIAIFADTQCLTRKKLERSEDEKGEAIIGFHQRCLPVLDLFERSLVDEVPVTWGI